MIQKKSYSFSFNETQRSANYSMFITLVSISNFVFTFK